MKKKIFSGIAALAFAAIVGLNVEMNTQDNKLVDISLANVEALAQEPGDGSFGACYINSYYTSCNFYNSGGYCPCGSY